MINSSHVLILCRFLRLPYFRDDFRTGISRSGLDYFTCVQITPQPAGLGPPTVVLTCSSPLDSRDLHFSSNDLRDDPTFMDSGVLPPPSRERRFYAPRSVSGDVWSGLSVTWPVSHPLPVGSTYYCPARHYLGGRVSRGLRGGS